MKKLGYLLIAVIFITACNNNTNTNTEHSGNDNETEADIIEVAVIDVTGMHCASCENAITSALTEIDGVTDAKASHTKQQAKVKFSASKVNIDDFKAAIEGKGYGVTKIEIIKIEDPSEDQQK